MSPGSSWAVVTLTALLRPQLVQLRLKVKNDELRLENDAARSRAEVAGADPAACARDQYNPVAQIKPGRGAGGTGQCHALPAVCNPARRPKTAPLRTEVEPV